MLIPILTAIHGLYIAAAVVGVISGRISAIQAVVALGGLATALALNRKGGRAARGAALAFSGLLLLLGAGGAAFSAWELVAGGHFEPLLLVACLLIALLGGGTLMALIRNKTKPAAVASAT